MVVGVVYIYGYERCILDNEWYKTGVYTALCGDVSGGDGGYTNIGSVCTHTYCVYTHSVDSLDDDNQHFSQVKWKLIDNRYPVLWKLCRLHQFICIQPCIKKCTNVHQSSCHVKLYHPTCWKYIYKWDINQLGLHSLWKQNQLKSFVELSSVVPLSYRFS